MIKIGFEQEFTFRNARGEYLDFTNSDYELFEKIVEGFPVVEGDERIFECKSLETVPRRCYVEGIERYDESGNLLATAPQALIAHSDETIASKTINHIDSITGCKLKTRADFRYAINASSNGTTGNKTDRRMIQGKPCICGTGPNTGTSTITSISIRTA